MQNDLIFDRKLLLSRRKKLADSLPKANFLIKRSFEDIKEKITEINKNYLNVLNLGSKYGSELLPGDVIEADSCQEILNSSSCKKKMLIDEENLVLNDNSFDLIVSALNLHSVNNLPGCLFKIKNALRSGGVFVASIFGGENLFELRQVLIETELELFGGVSPRMMPNIDIKQYGALAQKVGFTNVVVDSDVVKVHYKDPINLLHDIKNMGEANIMLNRNNKYVGKRFWECFSKNYRKLFAYNEEEVEASFEILTITAITGQF